MGEESTLRSLEMTFGKIPPLIRQYVKYICYNEERDDFTCVPCDKIIKKSYNSTQNTTVNFEKHLITAAHKSNTMSDDELLVNLNSTFSNNIPSIIAMNRHMLGMNGEDYECVKCEKILKVNNTNIPRTVNNFSYHFLSEGHEVALQDYRTTLGELYEIYGGVPRTVLNHVRFLNKNGNHYLCTICNKQLQVHPTDVEETEKCFEQHLHSLKHIRNAKQDRAFSLIPELKHIFSDLPNYMLMNIEYISTNGSNFFCSLCNVNIRLNKSNSFETELNFKQHILSYSHEQKLRHRRDPESNVFLRLQQLFEELPEVVQDNLRHLTVNEDDFYCEICKETIFNDDDDSNQTKQNLEYHFESDGHKSLVDFKSDVCSETLEYLTDVFGGIPEVIKENLKHIDYISGKDFKCVLCDKIMQAKYNGDYDDNTTVTVNNFEKHLNSIEHGNKVDEDENIGNDLITSLEEILCVIPQFVMNNLDHLSFADESDNFECLLCDKEIVVDSGNKKAEITEQNFRNHFLSGGHIAKLKNKANLVMATVDKLEFIFSKVPNFVVVNIQHIEQEGDHYRCTLCDAKLIQGGTSTSTEYKFREHLFGSRHRSNVEDLEQEYNEAFLHLDQSFWRIPEFILRNIDFLETIDDDLFCILCQETLHIDEEDLEQTKRSLRCHMDSERHRFSLRNI